MGLPHTCSITSFPAVQHVLCTEGKLELEWPLLSSAIAGLVCQHECARCHAVTLKPAPQAYGWDFLSAADS